MKSGGVKIHTIGFTKKSAEQFFGLLRSAGVKRIIDVRLKNVSQLAGFAKRDDLRFFLREICQADYIPMPELAPTEELLAYYRSKESSWPVYEDKFKRLISERKIETRLSPETAHEACLLCGEPTADHCHRRLVAEYLADKWGNVEIVHLV